MTSIVPSSVAKQTPPKVPGEQPPLSMVSSPTFFKAVLPLVWLIEEILVAGQMAVIGGPAKSLKTTLAIEMALSIATATPFLGRFRVPQALRVGLISGESGKATIQETARRICAAKGVRSETADVHWGFTLPRLDSPAGLAQLARAIKAWVLKVIIIDPLYLCLIGSSGVQSSNVYEMGSLLANVARTCLAAGATPILVHHTRKNVQTEGGALDLEHLSFAGIAETARQWTLLNRLSPFQPGSGKHSLRMAVGGSAGASGCWDLHVDEGAAGPDLKGRSWHVSVRPSGAGREAGGGYKTNGYQPKRQGRR